MIRIGIIGTGGMAHDHARNYRKIKGVTLTACCDINGERAREFARMFSIPASYPEYCQMLECERLDGISIVTTDAFHAPIAIAALKKNIAVLCEKPMADSLENARAMAEAARASTAVSMINFSKRNHYGLQYAASWIKRGKIGRIMHVDASYLQSWLVEKHWGDWRKSPAWLWRLSTKHGSMGVLGDLGCHIYDMASLLCGGFGSIFCTLGCFDKKAPGNRVGDYELDANDSFVSNVVFANGALGSIHASRWATGHVNREYISVFGDKGAVRVDMTHGIDQCEIYDMKAKEWKSVKCPKTPSNYERFIKAIKTGVNDVSNFENGLKIQAYLDSSVLSDTQKRPISIECT